MCSSTIYMTDWSILLRGTANRVESTQELDRNITAAVEWHGRTE